MDRKLTEQSRAVWASKLEFIFSSISYAVGFGNIWRFPYLCYKNGGGAFLIPYFICVIIGGFPILFLEISLGQFTSSAGMKTWKICPLMKGIGAGGSVLIFFGHSYYVTIMAWVLFYLCASFTTTLPWSHCNNYWNTDNCIAEFSKVDNSNFSINNQNNNTGITNDGELKNVNNTSHSDSATEFWERRVLRLSKGIDQPGAPLWDLSLCLLFCWLLTFFSLWKGIKTAGKLMYFILTLAYVMLTVILVRGAALPGSADGIKYYMVPTLERLADPLVWADAGTQVFYSIILGAGVYTALGSYNTFNQNSLRDSILIVGFNSFTSIFAGFSIFTLIGFMAHQQGVSVADVVESGPGLAFIVYPKAVAQMPLAPLWSILFFAMLFLLGLGSQIVAVESIVSGIVDQFAKVLRIGYRSQMVLCGICIMMFAIGLTMVTPGGIYVFNLFDNFAAGRPNLVIGFFQIITIAFLYGINKFCKDLKQMLGFSVEPYVKVMWCLISPVYTMILIGLGIYMYTGLKYNRTYVYPPWAVGVGWLLTSASISMVPVFVVIGILRNDGTLCQRVTKLLLPEENKKSEQNSTAMPEAVNLVQKQKEAEI